MGPLVKYEAACRAQAFARTMTGGAMPSMRVVVPRETRPKPYDLMQWRREAMEVSYVNELDPVELVTFATVALATVMFGLAATGYSFATWAWNLNVMGVA